MPNYHKNTKFIVKDPLSFKLSDYSTDYTDGLSEGKEIEKERIENTQDISKLQEKMYAEGKQGLLLVFQAMDAAGKDSTIKQVMTGVNPQGCRVVSFKQPSKKELSHDFLWRCSKRLPERGKIGIFNRSYYEEVLVCKVHPNYALGQNIGGYENLEDLNEEFWQNRYESIVDFEKHLSKNGYTVIKFFLNVGKEEQKKRFLRRIELERKNWKFGHGDIDERALWGKYMTAYEDMISATNTEKCPWFIIPADHKWFMRYAVSEIIKDTLKTMNPQYPALPEKEKQLLAKAKETLENES